MPTGDACMQSRGPSRGPTLGSVAGARRGGASRKSGPRLYVGGVQAQVRF